MSMMGIADLRGKANHSANRMAEAILSRPAFALLAASAILAGAALMLTEMALLITG